MMLQLNPPLPVDTPRGPAYAHLVIDYSQEHYVLFVCFLQETGECWVVPNRDVKLQQNLTMGVRLPPKPTRVPSADGNGHSRLGHVLNGT
ncbi:MAG: hypothetical protein K2X82_23465 [Gemmataceae bacterium]|nr:hypothetical protein [Gemmataceae bacterium]